MTKKKGDPGTPAKEETPDQFIDNRLVKLETGMTDLHSNLTSLEAGVSNMAAQQSMTDVKFTEALNRIMLRLDSELPLSGRQQTAAPSGGLGSQVQPEVISNLQHQFETPRPSGTPPLDPMTSMSAVRVNTSGLPPKAEATKPDMQTASPCSACSFECA